MIDTAGKGDVVVADPPYDGTFTDYSTHEWTDEEQRRLAGALLRAHARGAEVIAFNNDTPLVRGQYEWCHVLPTSESRKIKRADAGPRVRTTCVIMTTDMALLGE